MADSPTLLDVIKKKFSEATRSYDSNARVQDQASAVLSEHILEKVKQHSLKTLLEVGAGTGLLTRRLHQAGVFREMVITDLSETMLRVNRKLLAEPAGIAFHQADLHQFDLEKTFDVLAGNMCFQWVNDPELILSRLAERLNAGGIIGLSVPVFGSFLEWKQAAETAQVPFTANPLYGTGDWARFLSEAGLQVEVHVFETVNTFESMAAFFHSLKYIGAETATHAQPLTPIEMRKLLGSAPVPFLLTWKIAVLIGRKV